MIRNATSSDVNNLVYLFKKQHSEMGCSWSIDAAILMRTFLKAIESPDWLCLTGDDCLLLAVCFESPLGAGKLIQELCFCATTGHLDELVLMYENWARLKGCKTVSLACEQRFAAFERLYSRYGYLQTEATFTKVL